MSYYPIGPTATRPLLTSMLFLPSSISHCPKPKAMLSKWASNASWPPISPTAALWMHPSSGRNPRWFSRGRISADQLVFGQVQRETKPQPGEHSSLAWQCCYAHPQVSHSLTCTGWTHLDIYFLNNILLLYFTRLCFTLYPTCLYFTCFEL